MRFIDARTLTADRVVRALRFRWAQLSLASPADHLRDRPGRVPILAFGSSTL